MMTFFIILQFILLLFMLFHDWIPVPPLNDIPALKASSSDAGRSINSIVMGVFIFIPLWSTWNYSKIGMPFSECMNLVILYSMISIGTLLSWWKPYFFGSSVKHKQQFAKFKNTHHFLPPRRDHVVPNTLHVILHLQIWTCLAMSIYLAIIANH
jgi:hypothetical protein